MLAITVLARASSNLITRQPVEWSYSVSGISKELVGELVRGLLGFSRHELLLLEAGS
jgi:hypothetical protein